MKQKKSRGKVHAQRKVPADIRGHVRVPNVSPLSPTSRGQVAFENAKRKKQSRGKVRVQDKKVPVDTRGHMRVSNVPPLSPKSEGQVALENACASISELRKKLREMMEKELREKVEDTEKRLGSVFPEIFPGALMRLIYPPSTNVLVQTVCPETIEAGVQTSFKKASANKGVQTNQKTSTGNKSTWTRSGWFSQNQYTSTHSKKLPLYNTANSSVQTDNKKNSVPQSVSQSVQTDNEKNSVPQTVTQSVQAHDEEWQEVVTVGANKNKYHNVIVKKPEEEFIVPTSNRFAALSEENDILCISTNTNFLEAEEESQDVDVVISVDNSTNQIDKKEVAIQSNITMSESGSKLNHIAQPYVPKIPKTYYIQSPDGIVRVDKDESEGNEGVVSGLVESVHALVQVVLKQHEVNHNEASHGSSEPEDGRQVKIQKLQCRGVEFRNAKRHAFSKEGYLSSSALQAWSSGLSSEWDLYKERWDPPPEEHKFKLFSLLTI